MNTTIHALPAETSAATDAHLLRRLRGGDREAAEDLAERNYRRIFAYLYKCCGDRDAAADLTQETFRKAWQALGGFDGRASFSTWLHRIAFTTFLNSIRGPRAVAPPDGEPPPLPDPSPGADDVIGRRQEEAALRRAVLDLPDDLRFTVTAHFWGEMPVREIAAAERITTVAVRKRLAKALARLATLLREVSS